MNRWVVAFAISFLAAVVLLEASPWWRDKYFSVAGNESRAVTILREINVLESRHAATDLDEGFTCEPKRLKETSGGGNSNDLLPDWLAGEASGYRFTLTDCLREANGIVTHYRATAVPVRWHSTGVRAFCTDESGKLFYDSEGSPSQCFTLRKQLD